MPHIIGTTIYLRDYRMEDLDSIYEWRNLEEITRTLPSYVWPESLDQTRSFLEAQVKNTDPNNRKFAICSNQDDHYLGHIGYEYLNLRHRNTELGIVLGNPQELSKGMGTEAIQLFLKVCFDEMGLHRVGLKVLHTNERGIRCYQKCGFREEGAFREWAYMVKQWHHLMIMGILEDEYRALSNKAA